jgi:hypothetical protein
MAKIIGGITTSHVPAIGGAIAKNLQHDPYWKPFFDGFTPVRKWLGEAKPDVVVVLYNDHGLNFFLDKMPTFSGRRRARVPQRRRRLGHPHGAALPGRPGPVLAPDRVAGRRGVRPHHLPGDEGRPRLHAADGAAVARPGVAGARGAGVHQHRAGPAAQRQRCWKLGQAMAAPWPALGRATRRWWCWAPAA